MECTIFLVNINQEKSLAQADISDQHAKRDCCQYWGECCVAGWDIPWADFESFTENVGPEGKPVINLLSRVEKLLVRPETFGGLALDPVTAMVLKLDEEGLDALHLLQKGSDRDELVAHFGSARANDVDTFLGLLAGFRT